MYNFQSDNLIYNRFDLRYGLDIEHFVYKDKSLIYRIDSHCENNVVTINTWGKLFPQWVFEAAIKDIFDRYPESRYIEVGKSGNDYLNMLNEENDIRVPLPKTVEALLCRLSGKHRYTLKRLKRLIEAEYGRLETIIYQEDIPDEVVDLYFHWKRETHGMDYHMTPPEYLKKYYVTHALVLYAGEKPVGSLFLCIVGDTAYLENMSYDMKLSRLSVGYVTYEIALEQLVEKNCAYLYLGGGDYSYKKRFGAESNTVYSGRIYNPRMLEQFNEYLQTFAIKKVALYGMGMGGKAFLKLVDKLKLELIYCIDQEKRETGGLDLYSPENDMPDVDAVIITLREHNHVVDEFLKTKFRKFFYWEDFVKGNDCSG